LAVPAAGLRGRLAGPPAGRRRRRWRRPPGRGTPTAGLRRLPVLAVLVRLAVLLGLLARLRFRGSGRAGGRLDGAAGGAEDGRAVVLRTAPAAHRHRRALP